MVAASSIQWCRVAWDGWMDAVNKLRRVFFCLRNPIFSNGVLFLMTFPNTPARKINTFLHL